MVTDPANGESFRAFSMKICGALIELELELIQSRIEQKPVLWGEVANWRARLRRKLDSGEAQEGHRYYDRND